MLDLLLTPVRELHLVDLIDIAIVATFLYSAIVLVRRMQARLVAIGIVTLGAIYIAARAFDLRLTSWLLQGFFAVFIVILVVIFQEELRQLFERLALWSLGRRPGDARGRREDSELLVHVAGDLAERRRGALIVLAGQQPVHRHLHGGIELDGRLSEALLQSIFDPHSPGHDGAAVIEGDRVTRFAVQLPLSTDFRQLADLGTRHAAALGLAERTDALCIVVSEERGRIATAHRGQLRALARPHDLGPVVRQFVRATHPARGERRVLHALVRENWMEKIASLALVVGLWYLFVPGSRPATFSYPVPVKVANLPPDYVLDGVEPPAVTAVFTGLRRAFYLFDPSRTDLTIDVSSAKYGRRTFQVSAAQVRHPTDITVEDVRPDQVKISLRRIANGG